MQKLTIKTKVADFKAGKFIDEVKTAVVASTKSQNNLLDELKVSGVIVASTTVEEIFLDKEKTRNAVAVFVKEEIKDEAVANSVIAHIVKALDGACVFKKPPVVRKK